MTAAQSQKLDDIYTVLQETKEIASGGGDMVNISITYEGTATGADNDHDDKGIVTITVPEGYKFVGSGGGGVISAKGAGTNQLVITFHHRGDAAGTKGSGSVGIVRAATS